MSEVQNNLWPGWETVRLIGRGSFGAVYEIQRSMFGDVEKAALKVISIPQNASDIDELYSDGYDNESITSTFQSHLKSIVAEYSLMKKMSGCTNIVNCDDVRYVQHDDGIGWDIFIKMELLAPLTKALPGEVSEDTVIQIGKDICNALVLCKKHEIVHRDIKPQNIFVSPNGDYKLGDFGIAKTVEKTMGGTKIGTYKYMAPEVYNNQPYGSGADIYSLGLVLYWLLNERRMPFLPLPPAKMSASMEETARQRRLSGEMIPPPAHGSDELKRIVLKACAYEPSDRYTSATAMLDDLNRLHGGAETFLRGNYTGVPPEDIEDDKTTGPIFKGNANKPAGEELTDATIGPQFSPKKPTYSGEAEDAVNHLGAEAEREKAMGKRTIAYAIALLTLWIASVVFSVFVLRDIPRYVPHINGASAPWVYLSLVTGWIIPLVALLSLKNVVKPRSAKMLKTICKAAVFLQLFFLVCNLLLTFVPNLPVELYRIIPGAIYLEEIFWVIGSRFNEWMPFVTGLLAQLVLLTKDVVALIAVSTTKYDCLAQSSMDFAFYFSKITKWLPVILLIAYLLFLLFGL